MTDIKPELIEKAAEIIYDVMDYHGHNDIDCFPDARMDLYVTAATRSALLAVAVDLRTEGAAKALRDAADALDREESEEAAKVRMGNVRCLVCKLEWNQRGHFGCHGDYHEYDRADLSRAGEVRIEETYAGQFLRDRADAIEAGQSPDLPLHRTEAGYPYCSTCDGGGCPDCTDPA